MRSCKIHSGNSAPFSRESALFLVIWHIPCYNGLMKDFSSTHFYIQKENEGLVEFYTLAPGIRISFNQIHTNSCQRGDSSIFPERMLTLNFCLRGRCDASLAQNRYAIVKERQVCASTIPPTKDFYYPGRLYEGVQLYLDLAVLEQAHGQDLLTQMGLPLQPLIETFCGASGLYLHRMSDALFTLVSDAWRTREDAEPGLLRYLTVRLLHELAAMPCESEPDAYFTRSQIAIVKEAEALILSDLSRRITAKELADRFGISESSFKFYVKGILGDSYLAYFRKKRMEQAASLLESTNWKVIEIANAVGYENQGKFAKVFAETYGVSPLEFRRLSR